MKVEMPIGQGDLDDNEAQEAAQSRAGCAKAAGCRRDAQFWEGAGSGAAGAGSEREYVRSLAEPIRRNEGRRGGASQAIGRGEQEAQGGGGRADAGQPDAEVP